MLPKKAARLAGSGRAAQVIESDFASDWVLCRSAEACTLRSGSRPPTNFFCAEVVQAPGI